MGYAAKAHMVYGRGHMGKIQKANLKIQNSCCSTALLLFCSIFPFTASRFTQKNLPYPSLRKRDFLLAALFNSSHFVKGKSGGFSAALLLCCSTSPFTFHAFTASRLHDFFTDTDMLHFSRTW